jgi:hypothetical protein
MVDANRVNDQEQQVSQQNQQWALHMLDPQQKASNFNLGDVSYFAMQVLCI